jgi:nucleoid-associated protein YgaU
MDRLEQLKSKYQSVLTLISQSGVSLAHLHVQDNKLFLQGAAPSEAIKNNVWNQIKAVDQSYSDLTADISVDPSLPQPAPPAPAEQVYTVKAGDSLWKISQNLLGNGSLFKKIIEANPDKLKDEHSVIHPGDKLKIPVAS